MRETKSIHDEYAVLNEIGKGSYASVHKAINKRTGQICAIKKIQSATSEYNNLMNEINIISNSKHKNIVSFLASAYVNKELFIVMEYCCGGSVKDVMRQLRRPIDEERITVVIRDVLNGLNYLHSNDKIHRDVKAANILLNHEGLAKLGDFGVSEPLKDANKKQAIIGTPLWLPPEVIRQDQDYTAAIDIWSLGITIIEMADGVPPYQELEHSAAWVEIADLEKPAPTFKSPRHSQELVDFLALCLDKIPAKRKSAKELLSCDIIKKAPSNSVIKSLVEEVCTKSNRSLEMEAGFCDELDCIITHFNVLSKLYRERIMRVVRVDQMTEQFNKFQRDFAIKHEELMGKNARTDEIRAQLKNFKNEVQMYERERNDLKSTLEDLVKRKSEIIGQLEILGKSSIN